MEQQTPVSQEILDWRAELANPKDIEITLEEILKAMSNGFDVSSLFTDMLKLMTIKDIKLKKLVYIYLTSNARDNSEYALLLVNALVFDTENEQPLIRALALRTMAAVAINEVAEEFGEQFSKFSTDSDPFVRKTVCAGIAKLYMMGKQTCYDLDLVELLHKMLYDGNQTVVAAAVGALIQIAELPDTDEKFPIFSTEEADQLLTALAQSSEWSAFSILEGLNQYAEIGDTQLAAVRIEPFLQHGNPSVVLNAINLLIKLGQASSVSESLLSLVSQAESSEIQFVAMRALRLAGDLVSKDEFRRNIKVFYMRFNDEIYIKLEKIEILSGLVSEETAMDVLAELREYCQDVNDQIVRASLRAISKIAVLLPQAADMCIETYLLLLTGEYQEQKIEFRLPSYAAQELVICIENIFRYYPNRYEGIIGDLCEAIYEFNDYRAKASLIWILGEYADRIDSVEDVFKELLGFQQSAETLENEHAFVELACITTTAKIFLSEEKDTTEELFNSVIDSMLTSDEPGVRQRARYVERLFKLDPTLAFAKSIIYVQKSIPVYNDGVAPVLKQKLQCKLGSVPATLREIVIVQRTHENDAEDIIEEFENEEYVEEIEPVEEIGPEDMQQLSQPIESPLQSQGIVPEAGPFGAQLQPEMGVPHANLPTSMMYAQPNEPVMHEQTQNIIDDLLGFDFGSARTEPASYVPPPAPEATMYQQPPPPVFNAPASQPVFNAPTEEPVFNAPEQTQEMTNLQGTTPLPEEVYEASPPEEVQEMQQVAAPIEAPSDAYPYFNLPCRAKEQAYPLELRLGMIRANGSPLLQLFLKNISNQPILRPELRFMPNPFGIEAGDLGISIIPALNNYNNGNPVAVNIVAEQSGGSLVGKAGEFDPKMQSNFNVLTFELNEENGPSYFFKMKLPISILFSENSLWHENRALANPGAAATALNQSNGWPEFSDTVVVHGDSAHSIIQNACLDLERANFLEINISLELAEFVSCFELFDASAVAFTRLFWNIAGSAVEFKVIVRTPQTSSICGMYIASNAAEILGKK